MINPQQYATGGNVKDLLENGTPATSGKPWADKLFIIGVSMIGLISIIGGIAQHNGNGTLTLACLISIAATAPLPLLGIIFGTK